jgi:hypothetical protein
MTAEIEMENLTFPAQAEVKIELSITSAINFTAHVAQRRVSKLMLDRVGNLLYGERPSLVAAGERLLWRVPVWLGLPTVGPVGQAGALDVDTQTGEILFTQDILDEIKERGNALARRATPAAG